MAKGMYIGQGGIAHKVKKMYVSPDGMARKVKKGYVGVGGVARPFFSGEGAMPVYYGRATDLTVNRTCMSGVTMGNYALFAGDYYAWVRAFIQA